MARGLESLSDGATVFIDSTIFVYHFTGASADCRTFLERCECHELSGVTSAGVLAETMHRLMTLEAVVRGLVQPGSVARRLAEKPAVVRELSQYQRHVEAIPVMGIRVVPLDLVVLLRSAPLRMNHGLLTNDSLVAAAALQEAGGVLATADAAFSQVPGLTTHAPSDLQRA